MRRHGPVPPRLLALADGQGHLVSAAQCSAEGVSPNRRASLVRAGTWTRPTHGVYDTAPADVAAPDDARRRAAWLGLLALGPDAAAVGSCALALHGVRGLPSVVEPEVALAGGRRGRPRDGILVRRYEAPHVVVGTARAVPLPVALAQSLCRLPRRHVVAVLDDVLHRELLDDGETHRLVAALAGRRGCRRVRLWSELVDPRAESPLESYARLVCVDAGVPPDDLQVVVRDARGRPVARGDLGWRLPDGRWLLAEIDGREFHDVAEALLHDRHRQNALVATRGVEVLRFAAEDVSDGSVARTVRSVLGLHWRPSPTAPPTGNLLLEALAMR
ncbi:type IV toxin-antitoxin system AbiEi family antitoxin domain-containing protein [Cellulomonas flavigena]|uniref:type IV toxin-antitoxin system AbiEi family antitoxin domain-containing protein n=1 Tax=Cellulomonas flavigena TaxID=1711 RepID=UPI00019E4726|nr:type IV toxin-antitoxin system AbiEi family antitoxin domain-containing protein [Cellulomonas flavigena]